MNDNINHDDISSLIDNEISETKKKEEINNKIKNDSKLKFEYLTHRLLKKTIKEKIIKTELTISQKDQVLQKIRPDKNKKSFLNKLSIIRTKQFVAFSTFAVIFIAFALLIVNGPSISTNNNNDIVLEGSKSQNMFIQAVNNFQNIASGKMPLQMYSDKPEELMNFFRENGVSYISKINHLENCNLVGGIVSDFKGLKFAHVIYKDKNGNLLYMFQIDQKFLQDKSKIFLNTDLYQYLQNGNQYRLYLGNLLTIMTKVNNNICALISNLPEEKLPEKYKLKFASTYYKQPSILNN